MKKSGLQNAEIQKALAELGHTQSIVVADVGLPIPEGVKVIDLAVSNGMPDFMSVLTPIAGELVCEKYIYAQEMETANPQVLKQMREALGDAQAQAVSHEQFKVMVRDARAVIRTGSCKSYTNVILVGGVNF